MDTSLGTGVSRTSVAHCFLVNMTLTSVLNFRKIVSGAYLLFIYFLYKNTNFCVWIHLVVAACEILFFDHLNLVFVGICHIVTHFLFNLDFG